MNSSQCSRIGRPWFEKLKVRDADAQPGGLETSWKSHVRWSCPQVHCKDLVGPSRNLLGTSVNTFDDGLRCLNASVWSPSWIDIFWIEPLQTQEMTTNPSQFWIIFIPDKQQEAGEHLKGQGGRILPLCRSCDSCQTTGTCCSTYVSKMPCIQTLYIYIYIYICIYIYIYSDGLYSHMLTK